MQKNNKIFIVSSNYYQDILHPMEEDTKIVLDNA